MHFRNIFAETVDFSKTFPTKISIVLSQFHFHAGSCTQTCILCYYEHLAIKMIISESFLSIVNGD